MNESTIMFSRSLLLTTFLMFANTQSVMDQNRKWNALMPTKALLHFPESQRASRIGYIDESQIWSNVWRAWNPDQAIPKVDFHTEIVVWVRNTRYLNRIKLAGVHLGNKTAVMATQESRSAKPIADHLHCAMCVLPRKNVEHLSDGTKSIRVPPSSN